MSEPTVERSTSTLAVPIEELFTHEGRAALVGFLAGYSGQTRTAYTLDLRQYTSWCATHRLHLFTAKRADIECYARDLEVCGRARATIARRLCTVAGFYRYAVEEDLLEHSPGAHVRRPKLDYESHATALDRNEVGSLLVAAGLGKAAEHALMSLLVLNGLRIGEALGADIEARGCVPRSPHTLPRCRRDASPRDRTPAAPPTAPSCHSRGRRPLPPARARGSTVFGHSRADRSRSMATPSQSARIPTLISASGAASRRRRTPPPGPRRILSGNEM